LIELPGGTENFISRQVNTFIGEAGQLKVHYGTYQTLDGHQVKRVARVGDGSIITRFDKTPYPTSPFDVVCPHFLELKWATGCPYACAWCYLQGTYRFLDYKTKPHPKDFGRVEEHLLALFEENGKSPPEVLNAGELSDSMITENHKEPFTSFAMSLFGTQDKHRLLFVTKSPRIENLLKIPNTDQAIVSFSINAEKVAERWEKAPSIKERIEAAGKLKEAGFEVRIRIDPMVPIDGWNQEYSRLVDRIFERLTPDRITIGSLRGLQSTINNARDRSWVEYLEEKSNWGKKIKTDLRREMYSSLINYLQEETGYHGSIALCKETIQMWRELAIDFKDIRCNCTL
jgi:spore photoproduct lyase